METKIYRTSRKEAESRQIVKEDPSLHPSWLDEEAMGARLRAWMTKGAEQSSKDSPDAFPNSPTTED